MPDTRSHRGPHPEDARLFADEHHEALRAAVRDLSWLLGRGYNDTSALKLVGDRYRLTARQRIAVARSAASDEAVRDRSARRLAPDALAGRDLAIDAFNVITTVEAALGGGVLLRGRDGALRDMASMHGRYQRVSETGPALERIADRLERCRPASVRWWIDQPVSNSGKLKVLLAELAEARGLDWDIRIVPDPDRELIAGAAVAATADSGILDRCEQWSALASDVVADIPAPRVVDLTSPEPR